MHVFVCCTVCTEHATYVQEEQRRCWCMCFDCQSCLHGIAQQIAWSASFFAVDCSTSGYTSIVSALPNSRCRHANAYVTQQLPQLTALHSLRHLQLYKTAPLLLEDMQRLGQLTQLTSLLLADQSYMPGAAALVPVDVGPLSALTKLLSLGVAGVCPMMPTAIPVAGLSPAETFARQSRDELPAAAAQRQQSSSSSSSSSGVGCLADLPPSLTSMVIKRVDQIALSCWSYHLPLMTTLRDVRVLEYLEPFGSPEFHSFPSPVLGLLASSLTELTCLAFGISDVDNPRTWRGYNPSAVALPAALPASLRTSCLKHLQGLDLSFCQLSLHTAADWEVLGSLPRLTSLYGIRAGCVPPDGLQFPELLRLGLDNAHCCASAGQILAAQLQQEAGLAAAQGTSAQALRGPAVWRLNATFPKLCVLAVRLHSAAQWLGVQPVLAALTQLTGMRLDFLFRLDDAGAQSFVQLGYKLPALRDMNVLYSGGPLSWRLPRMHSFTQLRRLALGLTAPGVAVPDGEHEPLVVSDAVVLAHLLPLRGLTELRMRRMPAVTPGVVLGLCAAMTQLELLCFVRCHKMNEGGDAAASWEESELHCMMVRAALQEAAAVAAEGRVECEVVVYLHERAASRQQPLPCEVSNVTAHRQQF
jgi:hypothetical protein